MTNFEFYKDDIYVCSVVRGKQFALVDDKIFPCDLVVCQDCKFTCYRTGCTAKKFEWLYQEYVVKPTLSKIERLFCELAECGYIARDEDGALMWYLNKPLKNMKTYEWDPDSQRPEDRARCHVAAAPCMSDDNFPFINWEDEEPWAVEDLLKLEVRG